MPPQSSLEEQRRSANDKVRRAWAKEAKVYDRRIGWVERRLFGDEHRAWACSRVGGDVLEVAVGTGLNLPLYAGDVTVKGLDLSLEMLSIARRRAAESPADVELLEGDAHALPFADGSFDAVVCTFSLCNIPDPAVAVGEMKRVLKPSGKLVLVDHIESASRALYRLQRAVEFFTVRLQGEHFTRRPLRHVRDHGFDVVQRDRLRAGVIERLVAVKPRSAESLS